MPDIDIEQITPQLTWTLRRDALYPGKYKHDMEMPEDGEGTHFGAFVNNKLVAVVSLFNKGSDFQFRKFAVDVELQQQGIGTQLLQYITNHAIANGGTRLWCNARTAATAFYTKNGFTKAGEPFTKGDIEYVIMEKPLK